MIVILSSSSWSDLLQNEVSQIFKRIDMTKDDITLQLGERWAEELKKLQKLMGFHHIMYVQIVKIFW